MIGRLALQLKRWTGFAKIACQKLRKKKKMGKADKVKCDKRRAVEEHQNKMGDYDDYL